MVQRICSRGLLEDGVYEFSNYSGYSYFCSEKSERLTGITGAILASYQKDAEGVATIEVVPISEVLLYFNI